MSEFTVSNTQVRSSGINPWLIAITVTIATFMELLDTSIANVALPQIAGGLGRSFDYRYSYMDCF